MKKLKQKSFVEFESATTGEGIDARSLAHRYELIVLWSAEAGAGAKSADKPSET